MNVGRKVDEWDSQGKIRHIMITLQEKTFARIQFKNKVAFADGQAFENLFTQIMSYAESDFQAIKPWGNIGDRKNDGYIKSKGVFYQVFAPEEIEKSYPDVVKKLVGDFNGLLIHWNPVNEFYFVVNDKYKGVNADSEQALQSLLKSHKLNAAGFVTAKDLENLLFSLDEDQIFSVVGFVPDPASINLDYSVLSEVVGHLMGLSLQDMENSPNIYPDWDAKITFNKLDSLESRVLNSGFLQIGSLDAYLNGQSVFFADEVKDQIRKAYLKCAEESEGSELFWSVVNMISPKAESTYQASSIVLMAKYFECCDIFEEPQ